MRGINLILKKITYVVASEEKKDTFSIFTVTMVILAQFFLTFNIVKICNLNHGCILIKYFFQELHGFLIILYIVIQALKRKKKFCLLFICNYFHLWILYVHSIPKNKTPIIANSIYLTLLKILCDFESN